MPSEIDLGSFPPGSRVPVRFAARNRGRRPVEFSISTTNPALSLLTRRLVLRSSEEGTVIGAVAIGAVLPGPQSYRIRFDTPVPLETILRLEVVPPIVRLELVPPQLSIRAAEPGTTIQRPLTLNNTGNMPAKTSLTTTMSWLSIQPASLVLAPGESCSVKVIARTRKTQHGICAAQVRAEVAEGYMFAAPVTLLLPEPQLEAAAVDFGDISSDRPVYRTATLRNTGKIRLACTLATDQAWLAVSPTRVNVPPGGEKQVKLRATIPGEQAGAKIGALEVSFAGAQLLRVPVSAHCRIPKPKLGSIRKQNLGATASDEPVVRRFQVGNVGDGRLHCTVSANQPWIEILTRELAIGEGKKRRIEYRIETTAMALGENLAVIHIHSNGGEARVPVSVVVVEPAPVLDILGDLDLGTVADEDVATGQLSVRNSGVGTLHLSAKPENARVTVSPADVSLAPGPPTKLTVGVSLAGLAVGIHSYTIPFASDGGARLATVQFRVPLEEIEIPDLLVLGDRLVGRLVSDSVRVRNNGPDPVKLVVRSEDSWVRLFSDKVEVKPGEQVAVPFSIDLHQGVRGPVTTAVLFTGRMLRHKVAISLVARRIELFPVSNMIALGKMVPGEVRAIHLLVANRGDMPGEIRDLHVPGNLEVRLQRTEVAPGTTVSVPGRVRMNNRAIGKQVRTAVRLTDETVIQFFAQVRKSRLPRIESIVFAGAGLLAAIFLAFNDKSALGAIMGALGLLIAIGIRAFDRSK